MAAVDRSPCALCGAPVEVVAVPGRPTLEVANPKFIAVRVCSSLICPSNLAGAAPAASA